MNDIIIFIQDHYLIVTIIAGFLLLSLIGYLAQNFSSRDITIKKKEVTQDQEPTNVMNTEG